MNKILSVYVKEQEAYSKEDLKDLLDLSEEKFKLLAKKLQKCGILKKINYKSEQKKLTNLISMVPEYSDDYEQYQYVFKFVGILTVDNIVIKFFPKYLSNKKTPLEEMKQVLKVLQKYSSNEQVLNLLNGDKSKQSYNLLSIMLFMINDYHENGEYINYQEIIELNGEGEILWDNTINETIAIINNDCPFYLDLKTKSIVNNEMDYFTRLHKWIVTQCYKKLNYANLLELLELDNIHVSDEQLLDFGEVDYILYRLDRELNEQFITRKQNVLKAMIAYLSHISMEEDSLGISVYGTTNFNLVWQNVCATVFDDKLHIPIENLELPTPLHTDYMDRRKKTLIEIIEKPTWKYFASNDEIYENTAKETLEPDIISLFPIKGNMCFGIFDAKYYDLTLEQKALSGYPGVGDVTKQYLYQLAYNDFIFKHDFKYIINSFLMPTESDELIINGEVEMEILKDLSNPKLINILIIKLPANKIYQYYLDHEKVDIYNEFPTLNRYYTDIKRVNSDQSP